MLNIDKPRAGKKPKATSRSPERLTRLDWVNAARDALIKGGVHAVKVDLISNRLNITRGSFYWHFRNRADLLAALLELWESENTTPFEEAAQRKDLDPVQKFLAMVELWLEEKDFDPAFDAAVRDWARSSASVARKIASIDELRMSLLEKVFREMGYGQREAMVRARVTYYHQVGYYTLDVHESKKRRRDLLPVYIDILVGEGPLSRAREADRP